MSGVEVTTNGPFFDGRAELAVNDACKAIEQNVAYEGRQDVDMRLNIVLRTQTPHYRLLINARPEHPGWVINDRDCIYGPWLEGTGSRNRTTRFKGYKTFRLVAQKLRQKSRRIANGVLALYMDRMN